MIIGGLQRTSLSDFPGHVSAIVYTRGCNYRCPYCHNPDLIAGEGTEALDEAGVLAFLRSRRGRLDGVVITGGEPTLQGDLESFIRRVKALGLAVKLDTNGSRPEVLARLLERGLLDYVALDVKATAEGLQQVVGGSANGADVSRSIELLRGHPVTHEFRTTAVRSVIGRDEILAMGEQLRGQGRYVLQPFVSRRTLDPALEREPHNYSRDDLIAVRDELRSRGVACEVRGVA